MAEQNLVAVYDTAAHADGAVQALKAANVPAGAISRHAADTGTGAGAPDKSVWANLFGGESADTDILDRSIASGSTVVTVKVPEEHAARVSEILETHHPIDVDERAASYGTTQATTTGTAAASTRAPMPSASVSGDDTIKVFEERLVVGKRAVNRGGARVRSYVVETPVEEQVTLRDETVHVERHPVTDGRPATAADFQERTIEMSEIDEEAVVGKQARVVEEIGLRKEATDRVETVRDTVRRTEVDIEDTTGTTRTGAGVGVGTAGTPGSNPPGTMASRAVDKTLGTNVSGANPTRK